MENVSLMNTQYGETFAQGFIMGAVVGLLILYIVSLFDLGAILTYEYYTDDLNTDDPKNSIKRREYVFMK